MPTDDEIREMAKARVGFRAHAITYVLVNAFLIALWLWGSDFATPSLTGENYFWPVWSLLGWGIGLASHGWQAYGARGDAVSREETKLRAKYDMK